MPELHIQTKQINQAAAHQLEPFLEHFAEQWACDFQPISDGYLLLPEVMLRKHGIFVFFLENGCMVCREEDATSWEDFLLMKLAHLLAERYAATLLIDGSGEPLEIRPERFGTFDEYVETVLEFEDDLVKDMKKYWLYTHQKRSLR